MLTHGLPKLMKVLEGNFTFQDPFNIGSAASLILAVFAEFVCSILIFFGLSTRIATLPLIFTMATAAFVVHANDPFTKKELALIYLLIYCTILFLGPGKYSVDNLIVKKRKLY
jgi:putative oxidoreductase